MIPKIQTEIAAARQKDRPSLTYRIDWERRRISGRCDGRQAMEQAVRKVLDTERFAHLIYSWNYGAEFADLLGKPVSFVYPELEERITEALLQDERVLAVGPFEFTQMKGRVHVVCRVRTVFGTVEAQKEVTM